MSGSGYPDTIRVRNVTRGPDETVLFSHESEHKVSGLTMGPAAQAAFFANGQYRWTQVDEHDQPVFFYDMELLAADGAEVAS